jgi:hypothetical protein
MVAALLALGLVGVLGGCRGDDPGVGSALDNPRWGLRAGDVLRFERDDGRSVRLSVADVLPPDETFSYLRVVAVTVDAAGRPEALNLLAGDDDGYIPVGDPARPMAPSEFGGRIGQVLKGSAATITPGLVVIVPGEPSGDGDPAAAGFTRAGSGPIARADGYAALVEWPDLATRLDRAILPRVPAPAPPAAARKITRWSRHPTP